MSIPLSVAIVRFQGPARGHAIRPFAAAIAAAKAPKPSRGGSRAPRAPRGEVTTTTVAARAEAAAATETLTPDESGAN